MIGNSAFRASLGSSPRERGTLARIHPRRAACRFIPARAGNAAAATRTLPRSTVHPRASGERGAARLVVQPRSRFIPARAGNASEVTRQPGALAGSSPRERGTRSCGGLGRGRKRFIPARAGNASIPSSRIRFFAVHPRASGERRCAGRRLMTDNGSSPRERGTRVVRPNAAGQLRFIPARAGNADEACWAKANPNGSSPRERGTRARVVFAGLQARFIPARAGNAGGDDTRRRWEGGSSPRERGTLISLHSSQPPNRFIPARAGNAPGWTGKNPTWPVHPRASGERRAPVIAGSASTGSSPRERGTLGRLYATKSLPRFIPARAGNAHQHHHIVARESVHPRASGGFIPARAGNAFLPPAARYGNTVHPRASGER